MKSRFQIDKTYSVLIPDGESYFALPTLQCLGGAKNIEEYVLSKSRRASIRFSRYTKHSYLIPPESSDEERFAKILEIVKKNKIDIVLAAALDSLSFPVLIKPLRGDGGIGIKFFDNPSSLVDYCKERVAPKDYIVQSYIKGYDIDCSVLCRNGKILANTIQKRIINDPMYFGPTMNIDFLYDEKVYKIVTDVIGLLEWNGVVHFDLRFDEELNQVKIIEMNARYWGSIIGSYCAGVNFPFLAVLQGLNLEFPQIIYTPIRYVDSVTALRISFFGFLYKKNTISYYDHSKLKSHLRDPLPWLYSSGIQVFNKIDRALSRIHDKTKSNLTVKQCKLCLCQDLINTISPIQS